MFRAMTRAVLFDHTAVSSSMIRVDDSSDAYARLPARALFTVTSKSNVAPVNSGVPFSPAWATQ